MQLRAVIPIGTLSVSPSKLEVVNSYLLFEPRVGFSKYATAFFGNSRTALLSFVGIPLPIRELTFCYKANAYRTRVSNDPRRAASRNAHCIASGPPNLVRACLPRRYTGRVTDR